MSPVGQETVLCHRAIAVVVVNRKNTGQPGCGNTKGKICLSS
jgi:hypothetical protein